MQKKHNVQEFDQTLKALFGKEVADILPLLVPEARVLDEQNIELDRTTLKADLVYKASYKGQPHIINMELQTARDGIMEMRLLMYHAGLLLKYRLPVLSVVLYSFETAVPEPPFMEVGADGTLLTFVYKVLALWKLDAQEFVRMRAVCLYTLLPAMQRATAPLLKQALKEMKQHYPRQQLGHHLLRFHRIMSRSGTMTMQDKREIEEELQMEYAYDWFLDENPEVLERVDKGEKRGEIRGLQRSALTILKQRFPTLVAQAQPGIEQITSSDELDRLISLLALASNEVEVRRVLRVIST